MLTSRSVKLFGYLLIALLTMQSVTACYDGHGELDVASQHLPPHHQDAADGTPHLDRSVSDNHSASHHQTAGVSQADEDPDRVVLDQLAPSEHTNPDIAQDCNHCCHCHNSASLCLPSAHLAMVKFAGNHWSAAADSGFPHGYISALFRPPIA
ncbi:hypothetical protein [Microbulbifer sp.]|uniref:hypothetical protein n=1 Tax=Microbulbifer sp. TaxID=1908541 RepID=UPI00258CE6A0|nr:hypothetical protein [Microbulbifer sp.]